MKSIDIIKEVAAGAAFFTILGGMVYAILLLL